jgi:hypothetical protein
MYLTFSLNLKFIVLPDCPIYTLLHVLHFNLCIPLGSLWVCFSVSCCWIVLTARKAIFNLACLNRLVMRLTRGLNCVNVTHFFRGPIASYCYCFCFFFLITSFAFRSRVMLIG